MDYQTPLWVYHWYSHFRCNECIVPEPSPTAYVLTNTLTLSVVGNIISIYLSICGSTAVFWTLAAFFSFLIFYTDSRIPSARDQPFARPLPVCRTAQTQNKHTQTSAPQVGFEPTILVFQPAKTVHALDGAATVICREYMYLHILVISSVESIQRTIFLV
jgi:hypothetical protein